MDLLAKANDLLEKADKVREDKSLASHRREHEYCCLMLSWCTTMARADSRNAGSWSRLATEWSKRVSVALDALDKDKLDEIQAAIEAFRKDGDALERLE